jgi:hypothetical protein
MARTVEDITARLEELVKAGGEKKTDNPDIVAGYLEQLGREGTTGDSCACVLAVDLSEACGFALGEVKVQPGRLLGGSVVWEETVVEDGETYLGQFEVVLPPVLNALAMKFDDGEYNGLDKNFEPCPCDECVALEEA